MAINVWEMFQPVFRRNRHNFLLVIRKRGMLTVARRYHERTATQTTEQFGAVGSQMKETAHDREDSNRNKLAITGDKHLPGVNEESFEWTRSRLDSSKVQQCRCLHLDEDKSSPNSDRKDLTKTKESLCGILFYCYVFCLLFFGSNAPAA